MSLAAAPWLIALAWPIVKKVLVSLGIGFVTYSGMTLLADQVKAEIISAWGMLGQNALQVLTLGGVPQALGIILGGLSAGAALMAITKLQKV